MAVSILTLSLALVMSRSTWCLSESARDWCSLTCFSLTSALLERMRMGMFSMANCLICFIQISIELNEDLSVTEQTNKIPMADRQQDGVILRNLSCPAVSQTWMSTFLSLMLMMRSPQSSPTVGDSFSLKVFWLNWRRMDVLPTLLSPMRMYLTTSSQGRLFMQAIIYQVGIYTMMTQSQRGKQIKDYVLGETLVNYNDMHLLQGRREKGDEVTVLMIEKKCMQQETFLLYNNLLADNKLAIHPKYIEVIQSANNIYIVVEKITKILAGSSWGQLLPGLVDLYRRMGQFKLQESEVFVTGQGRVVYMPFYKRMQMTSKFYAQFHNKSVLGDLFSKLLPLPNKNIALDIFIRNIDNPKAVEIITSEISREIQAESGGSSPENGLYPTVSFEDEEQDDDEAIMQLMSKVKVNSDMKKEAGEQFLRLSAKQELQKEDKQIKNIIQNVESSMFKMAPIKRSTDRSKMDKLSDSKMQVDKLSDSKMQVDKLSDSKMQAEERKPQQNSFELYFKSYFQSLRFLKKSIKEFLSYYKNSFAGIISSFLLALIVTLRKAYLIKQLQSRNDIFELQIDMLAIPINKYVAFLKRDMKRQARMVCEFKSVIENCSMPMKTYSILAPYLEDDISLVDFQQLHTFTFFFLSALLKHKDPKHLHFLHVVDCMYILLHRNYEIVFFQSEFPRKWDQKYWDEKIALIQSLVPSWTL